MKIANSEGKKNTQKTQEKQAGTEKENSRRNVVNR